jgi:integrase
MKRTLNRLPAAHLHRKPDGMHSDGGGLYLRVRGDQRTWLLRYQRKGRVTEMGLGALMNVSLAQARAAATEARKLLSMGKDPLRDRRHARASMTFREAALACIADREGAWRGKRVKEQWLNTLERYAYPVIGTIPVDAIGTIDVLKVLRAIWTKRPEVAAKVRSRIENILDWATAQHLRNGSNPAVWRGVVRAVLPATAKLKTTRHHPALPYAQASAFMAALRERRGIAAQALQFLVLTAARTNEVLGTVWGEIDTVNKLWTIPASRMKSGKEHRVPLSDAAMSIIEDMAKLHPLLGSPLVFPGEGRNGKLSDMSLRRVLLRMKRVDITGHGFRSCFRDWAAETTGFPNYVVEQALAHAIGNAVEAAYRRGDLLEKRRQLMQAWASYCAAPAAGNVVALRKQASA